MKDEFNAGVGDFWPPPPPFIFVPLSPSLAAALCPLAFSSRCSRPPSPF